MVGSESLKLHCLVALGFLLQAHVLCLVLFVPELICFLLAFWQLTRLFYVFLLCNCYTDMLCKPVCVQMDSSQLPGDKAAQSTDSSVTNTPWLDGTQESS